MGQYRRVVLENQHTGRAPNLTSTRKMSSYKKSEKANIQMTLEKSKTKLNGFFFSQKFVNQVMLSLAYLDRVLWCCELDGERVPDLRW